MGSLHLGQGCVSISFSFDTDKDFIAFRFREAICIFCQSTETLHAKEASRHAVKSGGKIRRDKSLPQRVEVPLDSMLRVIADRG